MPKILKMPFFKSDKFFNEFLAILIVFALKTTNFAQSIDKTNFRIDTLKAYWTSGVAPAQIRGSIYLSFKIPAGKEAKVLMKTGPTGIYTAVGSFGDLTSTQTQHHSTRIPNLLVRDEIYCFYLELKNGASTLVTKELCSIPIAIEANLTSDNRYVFQLGSYQPGISNPNSAFRPFISGKCFGVNLGCTDDLDDFTTNTKLVAPYRARKEFNSFVKCGEKKVFEALIDVDGMITISDTIRKIGFTKQIPPKLNELLCYATVENENVNLIWENNTANRTGLDDYILENKFILERKDGENGNFQKISEIERLEGDNRQRWSYVDKTSTPSKIQHFYILRYQDYCDNESPNIDITPIFLQQNKDFKLFWNNHNNDLVINYYAELFDYIGATPRKTDIVTPKDNIWKTDVANYYRIKANWKNKSTGSEETDFYIYSNYIPNDLNLTVLNPNVFTPDGKGPIESETFKVFCLGNDEFEIIIYDRNGLMVYYSNDYKKHQRDGWNGKLIYTDIDCKEDQYVFQVNVTNSNHRGFVKRGNVLLVRE